MKTIEYLGNTYKVPDEAEYIATDEDGSLHWYTDEPYKTGQDTEWLMLSGSYGLVEGSSINHWKDSLRKI